MPEPTAGEVCLRAESEKLLKLETRPSFAG
jgi:hypothetical protein